MQSVKNTTFGENPRVNQYTNYIENGAGLTSLRENLVKGG